MSYLERLESGYWHYRFNRNKFLQWRVGNCAHNGQRISDGLNAVDLQEALEAAEASDPQAQPKASILEPTNA